MFERDRNYPVAFILDRAENAKAVAVRWVLDQAARQGGTPLLYAPGKQNVQHDELLRAFAQRYTLMTWKTRWGTDWRGGPVLAAWPDEKHLAEIADMTQVTALCVLAWGDDVAAWAAASGATNLDPQAPTATLPSLDPIVRQALISLGHRVNHSNQLAGALDRADAVTWFRILTRAGLPIDPEALYAHALANGWPGGGAARLKEMATKVAAGKSLQGWNEPRWSDDAVARWRAKAAESDGSA